MAGELTCPPLARRSQHRTEQPRRPRCSQKLRERAVSGPVCSQRRNQRLAVECRYIHHGCRTVIGSLSKVADHGTALLMSRFYEHWTANERADESLARAVQDTKTNYQHPLHWAPFLVLGDGA